MFSKSNQLNVVIIPDFLYYIEVYTINSSKMIGYFSTQLVRM
jgi:hypothetical protein